MSALSCFAHLGRNTKAVSDPENLAGDVPSRFFVFMGVCGAGKSTIAEAVASAISGDFLDADDLHPAANVAAMSEGRPLGDADRWPWLEAVCAAALTVDPARPVAIACSALMRRYRDFMRARLSAAVFIHLHGSPVLIRERMTHRRSHFMSPAMLESQLAALEPPDDEPGCHNLNVDGPQDAVIAQAISICRRHIAATQQGAPKASTESKTKPERLQRRKGNA